jgi:hypothetical protein
MEGEKVGQKELRAAILAIKGDESLDAETKAKKIRVRGPTGLMH